MAQEHDLFDDIIEISKGFDFLKNPLGGVTDALDPSAPQWNPADYKERPRGNTIPCLTCKNEKSGCTACMDVCPVNAIEVEEDSIEILDSCRQVRPVRRYLPDGGDHLSAPCTQKRLRRHCLGGYEPRDRLRYLHACP